jgi:DNA-binding transcriptional ArsR family regulator
MKLPQPAVSKHLGVLREVGVVTVDKQGQERIYRLQADPLKIVHDWARSFEALWSHQLDRIKQRAEQRTRESAKENNP